MFNKYSRGSNLRSIYPHASSGVDCVLGSTVQAGGSSSYLDIFENSIESPLPLLFRSHRSRLVHLPLLPLFLLHHLVLECDAPLPLLLLLHLLALALLCRLRFAWLLRSGRFLLRL